MVKLSGTEGYAEEAETLLGTYESISFADMHARIFHLLPKAPCCILDIGAGTGRDAAGFAALGHEVVAVEPVDEMRAGARKLHPALNIDWIDDGLPALAVLRARGGTFDVATMTAVWMHLDESQRCEAMPNVAALVRPGGVLILSLRYGPVPPGRRMFEVSVEETVELAATQGLRVVMNEAAPTLIKRAMPVTWKRLAFRKS
jgi:SAM-dependent methyltransferase